MVVETERYKTKTATGHLDYSEPEQSYNTSEGSGYAGTLKDWKRANKTGVGVDDVDLGAGK
ncbi:hypothetical protein [Prochlorococcus sp. MIT 1227]|uniref:hypothetical protein n=1 Tax=Prochlorococcus sp. MIT 1227 TaxID=3082536 RepID=UPI0039A6C0E2